MAILDALAKIVGQDHVLTGDAAEHYGKGWVKSYHHVPAAVIRPGSTSEVSQVLKIAHDAGVPIIPVSGNTGLTGATYAQDQIMLSLERMNQIEEIRPDARIAIVQSGAILTSIHEAVDEHDLVFPLTFGARGSAMIGGALSTNAGGSNVVRYGSTRGLCLGIEVVLADGRVMDLMSELHKDNSGYDLKDLFIGAEGTLGIITRAVVKLFPKPKAYATAMVATVDLPAALTLLNKLQISTGGLVEAFEYMPGNYIETHLKVIPGGKPPFEERYDTNIMVEIAATSPSLANVNEDGSIPIVGSLEEILAELMEDGAILDAVVAKSDAQRSEMWARREAAAEVSFSQGMAVDTDIAVPTDKVPAFFDGIRARVSEYDAQATDSCVAHLGDGNVHYSVYPTRNDPDAHDVIVEMIEDVVLSLGGSFSAEHGVGLSKRPSMARRKDPIALDMMRTLKTAFDPKNILNPGKIFPETS